MGLIQVETPYWQTLPLGSTTAPPSNVVIQSVENSFMSSLDSKKAKSVVSTSKLRRTERRASPIPSGWTSGGCVVDVSSRILQGSYTTSSTNTPASCIATCTSKCVIILLLFLCAGYLQLIGGSLLLEWSMETSAIVGPAMQEVLQ